MIKDFIRKRSINLCLVMTGGCNGCDIEIAALLSQRYDLEQYGIYLHNNPRECDAILVTGTVAKQWQEKLVEFYNKVPEPKAVVAIGACALSGGIFQQESEKVGAPVSEIIPVDAEVPGCAPRPAEIAMAVLKYVPPALANYRRKS
jgi:energy-converting hydrogenase A subunit N